VFTLVQVDHTISDSQPAPFAADDVQQSLPTSTIHERMYHFTDGDLLPVRGRLRFPMGQIAC